MKARNLERFGRLFWGRWTEYRQTQGELRRVLREAPNGGGEDAFPPVDVWTNEVGAVITVRVPGVDLEGLALHLDGRELTIEGTLPASEQPFARTVPLSFDPDARGVRATFDEGVLEVHVPRRGAHVASANTDDD